MKHILYIPASYTALIYALLTGIGLLLALFVGLVAHGKEILLNGCGKDHYEFWPSISTTIGDVLPERQIWRSSFVLCCPFRVGATIAMFNVFWQKGTGGMAELYRLRQSPLKFIASSAFVTLLTFWVDVWRLVSAVVWTMTASIESLAYHNLGFCPYVFLCFVLQVTQTLLVRRNQCNLSIYPVQRDAHKSYRLKRFCMIGESIAAVGVVGFFLRHFTTCAPGSFSLSTMCEWVFAFFNIAYDFSAWYDLKNEGWWLSGTPEFYRTLWAKRNSAARYPYAAGVTTEGGAEVSAESATTTKRLTASSSVEATATTRSSADGGTIFVSIGGDSDTGVEPDIGSSPEALSIPPLTTTGEFFLSKDIVLHRFAFCSAPSRLSLWLCDIYWAHLLFESMIHLVEHMYFMPLIAMSLSWEIASISVFGVPCLMRIPSFRRWATGPCFFARGFLKPTITPIGTSHRVVPMYVFFYFVASLSHLHMLVLHSPGNKILAVAVGPLFVLLSITTRFLYPSSATLKSSGAESNEDARRGLYALPLGLVLCMLLRILYISQSPMYVEPLYSGLFGIVLGIAFTTIIYRHVMFGNTLKETVSVVSTAVATAAAAAAGTANGSSAAATVDGNPSTSASAFRSDKDDDGTALTGKDEYEGHGTDHDGTGARVQFSRSQRDEVTANTISALALAYTPASQAMLGILFGLTTSIAMTFYTCANYIPRLLAIDPFPASLFITITFAAGVYFSTDVIPICPQIMTVSAHRLGIIRRFLRSAFAASWRRLGAAMMFGCFLMLFSTRQTNFSYETQHKGYPVSYETPKEDVLVKYWEVQETFAGSKHLAFAGGLLLTFCFAALLPVVMELTFATIRARRLAALTDCLDPNSIYRRECTFFTSFEMTWLLSNLIMCAMYVLVVSYPFIPGAWIMRERSRSVIFAHFLLFFLVAWHCGRRVRGVKSSSVVSDTAAACKQRSVQLMIAIILVFATISIVIGRVALQTPSASFPAGKTTALQYPNQVMHLHEMLIKMRIERNVATDPLLKDYERDYQMLRFEEMLTEIDRNITRATKTNLPDPKFGLAGLSYDDSVDVWNAAKAMTFFSGLIWTVHFGLDNFDVDSFNKMVHEARISEAGVIGLLESDSMHVTNGNRDMVEHMSYYLGYEYTDYGPTVLDNTYGCALISRYPIRSVRRYIMPSPLGELACLIYAELDVYGIVINTYVGHFGNTHHWADGLLQSQFLGRLVQSKPGPSMWLGYLVTYPGNEERYHQYTDPYGPGKFRDAGLDMYVNRPWVRLKERGGYDEVPPPPFSTNQPGEELDFNVEYKMQFIGGLERSVAHPDTSFRRPPADKPPRHFYFNQTNRYSDAHPRFEFIDRYCQYSFYKTGLPTDELPEAASKLSPYSVELFDWWRKVGGGVENLSDTEIQVIQLRFRHSSISHSSS